MQPLVIAEQTRQGIADFLKATFPATTPGFEGLMGRFLDEPRNLAKGPYITLGLPFRPAPPGPPAFAWHPSFRPHAHQALAFARLSGPEPRSTLVATGTGSGKTEAFLFPILEHCRQMRVAGRRGVKAILIYPMNALATDQSNRIAREIVTRPELSSLTAGLYVGDEPEEKSTTVRHLSGDRYTLITDRERMREEPPDILLTNYRMLDFLLMRARDAALWRYNEPDTLRFLVVDELHAYDGAQGTDLACLIRRLKGRLGTPPETLSCVGTSATLGTGTNDRLLAFARDVFGEEIDADAVIGEERESVAEYLRDNPVEYVDMPDAGDLTALSPLSYGSAPAYLGAQYRIWFGEEADEQRVSTLAFQVQLGERLKRHVAFQNLLRDLHHLGSRAVDLADLSEIVRRRLRATEDFDRDLPRLWIGSLLALIAHASRPTLGPDREPLLTLRVELWARELRRMVASLSPEPVLVHSDDLPASEVRVFLAPIHCRDCHVMGWGATQTATDGAVLRADLQQFYAAFFSHDVSTRFVFPANPAVSPDRKKFERRKACTTCGAISPEGSQTCGRCGEDDLFLVDVAHNLRQGRRNGAAYTRSHNDCPYCEGDRTLTIVGSQAASLASIALGQFFGTLYNTDKKIIAFSDSVQDAAHRAGFFEARNWRLNLRPAMAQVIDTAAAQGTPLTLEQFPDAFEARWLPRLGDRDYVKSFLSPSLNWLRDYQALLCDNAPPTDYLSMVARRGIDWALMGEFGQDAHVGRTLPRTLTATVAFDIASLDAATEVCLLHLRERVEPLRDAGGAEVREFLHGLLARMLRIGAIWHKQLETYAAKGCNIFAYRNNPAEFALLKSPRRPHYLTLIPYENCESATGAKAHFYSDWAISVFRELELTVDDTVFADVYRIALEALEDQGFTRKLSAERAGILVWGIEPATCRLVRGGREWRCDRCRNAVIAEPGLDLDGTMCRQIGCRGHYRAQATQDLRFYQQLYLSADIRRILAHEHTGLLDRTRREEVENDFKLGRINVLSATPTLEMGIDIGDLSSVVLASVPPQPANYVQRIGRAGRRTGNAFVPTLAAGRPHDLYFWEQPREMLAGDIEAPGIFLNASAVLERQLTAFTLDSWVKVAGESAKVPSKLSEVLSAVRSNTARKFPYPWFKFIEERQGELLDGFVELFATGKTALEPETRDHLEAFLRGADGEGAGLRWKVLNALVRVIRDLDDLKRRRNRAESEIEKIEAQPAIGESAEVELRDLKNERTALTKLMAGINGRDTFQFLTDEGLIPNYAFPEQGVTLRSVIVRDDRRVNENDRVVTLEYERPGVSAITEFAPNSVFYAEGRKVTIDQVDVSQDKPGDWRFCRSCSYAEQELGQTALSVCPRCGDPFWSDAGRLQKMMRLTRVYARTLESHSRIGDDADDRERRFFVRQALIDVAPEAIRQAWKVDDTDMPFAFEFISRIRFQEVNFGEQTGDGAPIRIAGDESRKPGFEICPECGTVRRHRRSQDAWKNHALYCSRRNQDDPATQECVFLYREFQSEGIRVYLPPTPGVLPEQMVHSFIAALQMGLELKFHGSVDHLRVARNVTIAQGQEEPRQYLVIYDSVPGGTGYLKTLMRDPEPLFEVFTLALDALNACACNSDENKDGCYRCVYTYHNSHDRKHVSRRAAVAILSQLVANRGSLVPIDSISGVEPPNALFDSELERRFIEALRRRPLDGSPRFEVREDLVRGKPGYFLKAGDLSWSIEPQVTLGPEQGVVIRCKPDFVLWPVTAPGRLPIAVFLDGWQYHKDRVGDDIAKRMAVARSGKYSVWTMTADDVALALDPACPVPETIWTQALPGMTDQAAPMYERFGIGGLRSFHARTAFEQFRERIGSVTDGEVRKVALALSLRIGAAPLDPSAFEGLKDSVAHEAIVLSQVFDWPSGADLGRCWAPPSGAIQIGVQARRADMARLPAEPEARACQPCTVLRWAASPGADDADTKRLWQQWWQAANLLLFPVNGWAASDAGCDLTPLVGAPGYATNTMSDDWQAASELADSSIRALLGDLFALGVPAPEVGYELLGADGRVEGECELAWPGARVAVVLQGGSKSPFVVAGWTVFSTDESALADRIADSLR